MCRYYYYIIKPALKKYLMRISLPDEKILKNPPQSGARDKYGSICPTKRGSVLNNKPANMFIHLKVYVTHLISLDLSSQSLHLLFIGCLFAQNDI